MSIISELCAEQHNKEINEFKKKFEHCDTFEEFQDVLKEFQNLSFSE